MSDNFVATLISASAIILGSLIGAIFSWFISKKTTIKNIKEQYKLQEQNRQYEESYRLKEICIHANVVRLDICTAIFQSIRNLQNLQCNSYLYVIPICKDYQKAVASLSDKYNLKELSYIYQLYGIIEKVNKDIFDWKAGDIEGYKVIQMGLKDILKKVYGDNYKHLVNSNIDEVSYEDIHNNEYIKEGYKEVLKTLDNLCYAENINNAKKSDTDPNTKGC